MIAMKLSIPQEEINIITDVVKRGEHVLVPQPNGTNLVVLSEFEYKKLEKNVKSNGKRTLKEVFNDLQDEALNNGTSDMTIDEINILITEARAQSKLRRDVP